MGSAQSAQPSKISPPRRVDNGNTINGGYIRARRSTGQGQGRFDTESRKPVLKQESRNGNVIYLSNGKEGKVMLNSSSSSNSNGDHVNNGSVNSNRVDDTTKKSTEEEEDQLVDGWPKWLVRNIPRDALSNIVPKSADSYDKIDKVGQGTYSNVYKAREKSTGKIVALKKVRFDTTEPESVKFMAREIMILQKLDHPNIIKLQGLATSRMQYSIYLVFEYMHSDLTKIISRPDEILSEPQIKCYMQQLLSALQHCHEHGILHRDIKGSNLLIDKNGILKIADFGLANFFDPVKRHPLTSRVVTLWYRAPELLLGCNDYGIGIDLWSAGCLMAEMLAGRPIMPARTEVEQLHRIFKLCGTPSDDYFKRFKLSAQLKPAQAYKSSFREAFRNFPSHSLGLLKILLSLDPGNRGTANSALQNEYFHTSPLACDVSGLPKIHTEEDDHAPINERRKHRTSKSRRRSQSLRDQRKKNPSTEIAKVDAEASNQEVEKKADTSVFGLEPGSSSTSTSSTSVKPQAKEEDSPPRLFPSPNINTSPRTEVHSNVNNNTKNRAPLPTARGNTNNYNTKSDGANRLNNVQRSASTREFRGLQNKNQLKQYSVDD
ncbi:hypothetical protein ABFX02_14G307400 [Erythranthe guttata]